MQHAPAHLPLEFVENSVLDDLGGYACPVTEEHLALGVAAMDVAMREAKAQMADGYHDAAFWLGDDDAMRALIEALGLQDNLQWAGILVRDLVSSAFCLLDRAAYDADNRDPVFTCHNCSAEIAHDGNCDSCAAIPHAHHRHFYFTNH